MASSLSAGQSQSFNLLYNEIRQSIFAFCKAFNFRPTYQQVQLLQAVEDAAHHKGSNWIACKSGQGPGKTTVSAIAGLWWAFRSFDCRGLVTAPTMRQCSKIWLPEAEKRIEEADPSVGRFFECTKTSVQIMGRDNWGVTLTTAKKSENAQGFHNPNQFVIVEEASGVARDIVTQYKGTNSNPDSLLLLIGNPNTRDCVFFDCFYGQARDRWKTMTFNAEDTAKYYPRIVSPQRNKDLENEFSRDSDVYRIRVLGEFPHSDPNSLFKLEDLNDCCDQADLVRCSKLNRSETSEEIARQIALDYARFGGDESIVMRRSGEAIVEWKNFAHTEPTEVTRFAMAMQKAAFWSDQDTIFVPDATGMGQGTLGLFYEEGKNVFEWHNGGASRDQSFANLATQGYFELRRKVQHHKVNGGKPRVCIPLDQILFNQLTTRWYFTNKDGKLILEDKDSYMKRGHDSPDRADCLVEVFWDGVVTRGNVDLLKSSSPPSDVSKGHRMSLGGSLRVRT